MAEIIPYIQLEHKIGFLRKRNNEIKIVATNGCFDILHIGHIRYLQKAKTYGDLLIVGINTDHSVKKLKGDSRPINSEALRAEALASLDCVDIVSIFPEDTASNLLEKINPSIYIKGGDYDINTIPEKDIIEKLDIKFLTVPIVPGFSTSELINKMQQLKP